VLCCLIWIRSLPSPYAYICKHNNNDKCVPNCVVCSVLCSTVDQRPLGSRSRKSSGGHSLTRLTFFSCLQSRAEFKYKAEIEPKTTSTLSFGRKFQPYSSSSCERVPMLFAFFAACCEPVNCTHNLDNHFKHALFRTSHFNVLIPMCECV